MTGPSFERVRAGEVVRLQADVVCPVCGPRTTDILMQAARDEEGARSACSCAAPRSRNSRPRGASRSVWPIDPARLGELGRLFRRLHARRKLAGTGLGPAIARRIAEQHGGRLDITSMPGEGRRSSLVMPDAASRAAADAALLQFPADTP